MAVTPALPRRSLTLPSVPSVKFTGDQFRIRPAGGGAGRGKAAPAPVRPAVTLPLELGVNFVDTARGYGESERIVGRVVRARAGDPVYVAAKVPPLNGIWPARGAPLAAQLPLLTPAARARRGAPPGPGPVSRPG
ncbi:aldo/keto reductase [Streptomyces sp. NPDC051211]|uniref:aldo/keto reductase n=1 Tax=Streptomyces sp. NPDC051211 TaxID=3154643 RepID=UPI00344DD552